MEVKKIQDYLGYAEYLHRDINYDYANNFFHNRFDGIVLGGCSSVRNGQYYGRNYDWTYDENAEFLVRVKSDGKRYGSISVCSAAQITNEMLTNREYTKNYDILPFMACDGINENGVAVNMNIVPDDMGTTKQFNFKKRDLCSIMIPRYILDHAKTAEEGANSILNFNVFGVPHNEIHIMVADANKTFLIEFIDNETIITDISDKPYITNFHRQGVSHDPNGKVDWSTVEPHGMGLERYDYIVENYASANTEEGMLNLMLGLRFSKAYTQTDPLAWKSEFTGDDITINSTDDEFMAVIEIARDRWEHRSRDERSEYFGVWHTAHASIIDIQNKTLKLLVQEQEVDTMFTFKVQEDDNRRYIQLSNHYYGISKTQYDSLPTDENGVHYTDNDKIEDGSQLEVKDDEKKEVVTYCSCINHKWYER